jgi:hypothetical protein
MCSTAASGRQKREKTSQGRGGTKAGGTDAPTVGDRRGIPAAGLRNEEGVLTDANGNKREENDYRLLSVSSSNGQERNHEPPRPGDCAKVAERHSSQIRWQHPDGSDPNVHRAATAAHEECGWKRGGAVFVRPLVREKHLILDDERPPHGSDLLENRAGQSTKGLGYEWFIEVACCRRRQAGNQVARTPLQGLNGRRTTVKERRECVTSTVCAHSPLLSC